MSESHIVYDVRYKVAYNTCQSPNVKGRHNPAAMSSRHTHSREAKPMSNYRTKTDLVYQELRRQILDGRFPPGARIVVDQLALELGTSKVPVREAIVRLAGEGWLEMRPHVGATIPELRPEEIVETSLIRSVVEGAAVRLAASHMTAATLDRLRSLLTQMERAVTDVARYPELNAKFHAAAFEACPHPNLRSMAQSLLEKSFRLRTVRFLPEYLAESQIEHRNLVTALERGDGQRAEEIIRHHVEHAGELLSQYAQHHRGQDELSA